MAQFNSLRSFLTLQAETVWEDGGGGTDIFMPMLDGDYTVGLDDPLREQQHVVGDADSQYIVQDVRNLVGEMKMGLWPHLALTQFNIGAKRTAGQMESYAGRLTFPGVETRIHYGLMAESIKVSGQNGGDIIVTTGLRGSYEGTAGVVSYPGSFTIPATHSLLFKNCRFVISLDAGSAFSNRIVPVGLEAFEVTLMNNLKVGPAREDRVDTTKDGRCEFLDAGRRKVDLSYTAAFERLAYSTLQRARKFTQFKMLGAHPGYTTYATVGVAGAAAGSAVVVPVGADPTAGFAVGDVVMFDNAGGANKPCVGTVTAAATGPNTITIDVLDEAAVSGDHIFNAAVELKTAPCRVSSSIPSKPFDDYVKVAVAAQAFSGGADPFTFKAKNMTLPA